MGNRVRLNATAPPAYPERDGAVVCGAAHLHLTAYLPQLALLARHVVALYAPVTLQHQRVTI
jgi:hypothetical protein